MIILGVSCFYHDSAATIIVDGEVISAAQEERFTRVKHDASFPLHSILFCLKKNSLSLNQVDYVVFYEKPFVKFERLLETYLTYAPKGFSSFAKAMPLWIKEKLFQKQHLLKELKKIDPGFKEKKILFSEHHLSHSASAFYPSPFSEAVVLTMDGVGEWSTTSVSIGKGSDLEIIKEMRFPHSLGLLYSAFTYFLGFKVNSGEYKLMGLAPYGTPKYADQILSEMIDIKEDGSFRLSMKYFDYCVGLKMTSKKFEKFFGTKARQSESPIEAIHMDIAASIQSVLEVIIIKITDFLAKEYKIQNLCLSGGVALNCVANGKIAERGKFKKIWVQPASGDAGGAIGAALAGYHLHLNYPRTVFPEDGMKGAYLGPSFSNEEVELSLRKCGAKYKKLSDEELFKQVAKALAEGKAVGWMQGPMEFGPRALGARSIIADPRSESMQKTLNLKIKFRESFRPFAPAVLEEDASDWFYLKERSPYMLFVHEVDESKRLPQDKVSNKLIGIEKLKVKRSLIPAVTHVDNTARVQTVGSKENQRFYTLLKEFKKLTNCPVLINTSFNVRGEPIVCTPEDAFKCFMGTELDLLIIENYLLEKDQQNSELKQGYCAQFPPD